MMGMMGMRGMRGMSVKGDTSPYDRGRSTSRRRSPGLEVLQASNCSFSMYCSRLSWKHSFNFVCGAAEIAVSPGQ